MVRMNTTPYITSWCRIQSNKVCVNGDVQFTSNEALATDEFLKQAFKALNKPYMKFYKMDLLSKLGFTAAEYLLQTNPFSELLDPTDKGIVLSNRSASLETDTQHQQSIADRENYFPSPAIFVYTLPNIVIGEICIKNAIKGENTFFITDHFDTRFTAEYIGGLMSENRIKNCILGWVELSDDGQFFDAFLAMTSALENPLNKKLTAENLAALYNQQ